MNDIVKKYLLEKYQTENPEDQVKQDYENQSVNPFAAFASGVGQALSRQNVNLDWVDKANKEAYDRTVGKLEQDKKNALIDFQAQQEFKKVQQDDELFNKLSDLNSIETKTYQSLAKKMLPTGNFEKMSGKQILAQLPTLEKLYKIDSDRQDRLLAKQDRQFLQSEREKEKTQALQTPFGLANSVDDAKTLKDAYESKKNFDNKLSQMIELRQNYGGELFNRDAVARGKQLSKDLLLEYKNMAKLGVLSKSDEDIINAIIPEDPLGFNFIPNQDPIMEKLTQFKADSDKDFQTKIKTRTREGLNQLQQNANPVRNVFPMKLKKDGEMVTVSNEDELREAQSEGWK